MSTAFNIFETQMNADEKEINADRLMSDPVLSAFIMELKPRFSAITKY
ncbi:MAG: hypothetical protein NUV51_06250 [Sulfuricaulis sp.]|nr:hypothetical protein [Sulfuricaulis sp.]